MINHLSSRSFTNAMQLTLPPHWQLAECSLNKMKCAQTRVVRDSYLFTGYFIGKAILAALIIWPNILVAYPKGMFLTHVIITVDFPSQWVAILTMVVQGPKFLPTYSATI